MKTKIFVISIIIALIAASLPVASVFAAPARDGDPTEENSLKLEWSNKTRLLHYENLFFSRVKVLPADFENKDDLARAYELLNKYEFALKQANEIALKHTGFDKNGGLVDIEDADQSVKDLSMYLHMMRGLRGKIAEAGYPIRTK